MVLREGNAAIKKLRPLSISTSAQTLALVFIVLLLLSINLSGIKVFIVAGHIDIALWDIATVLIFLLWFSYIALVRLKVSRHLVMGFTLIVPFTIWIGLQVFKSPQPIRGLTMFLLLLRNIMIFLMISTMANRLVDLDRVNKAVFFIGIVISTLAVILFVDALRNFSMISNIRRPYGGIILMVDEGHIPRLIGFARDPNFYSLWMALSLFCGFNVTSVSRLIKILGLSIISLSLLLTLSRSFLIFFVISTIILWSILFFLRRLSLVWRYVRPLTILSIILVIGLLSVRSMGVDPLESLAFRFAMIGSSPRFVYWESIVTKLSNPAFLVFGAGLRAAEEELGGYSHNSYLDLLFETGLIGFALWTLFAIFTTMRGIASLSQRAGLLPWLHVWLLTLFMFLSFSLMYNPFPWLVAALIWSQGENRGAT